MTRRHRLTVVMTHPVQYYSPWFRYVHDEATELDLRVLYVSRPTPSQQGVGFCESFEWDLEMTEGYESEVLHPSRQTHRFDTGSFLGLDAPEIGVAIERSRPDAVLIMGWHCLALVRAILACRRRGIPLLYRGDTTSPSSNRPINRSLWQLRTSWLLSRFDRYLAVGSRVREHLCRFGIPEERIFRSPHAVDNAFFARTAEPYRQIEARAAERRRMRVDPNTFLVLFVGKLERIKRVDDAIRGLSRIPEPASLLVVGSGPLRQSLEALATELRVSVSWQGFVNQTELGKFYALADCCVLPSESETWGLVVNEALASGVPCVVSDRVGCAPDLIESGASGEVFPVGDVAALTESLSRLSQEIQSGVSRAAACREKAREYSYEAATEGLVAACHSLNVG